MANIYPLCPTLSSMLGCWDLDGISHASPCSYDFTALGSTIFFTFIVTLWSSLGRPPLSTMGETRLWYSLFLSVIGIFLYGRYNYKWILCFSNTMALVFVGINLLHPEIHETILMPALQSWWFVPHVVVYMFSYALLGAATLFALYLWCKMRHSDITDSELSLCDHLVRTGWTFLSLGMVMGALWAKEAWGDYWSWDPKETWAFATWLSYLFYLHLRPSCRHLQLQFGWLLFSFLLLQLCWWGINYLPAAQGMSIHTYSS